MKSLKIILLTILLILLLSITVNANEKKVHNLVEDYLKSYMLENTSENLKIKFYEIKNINIISENDSEIIAQYEAEIIPYSENHSWATTHLYYYIKIEKNNNMWKITEQTTSPIEIEKKDSNNSKQITYQLIEDYLKSYQSENITNDLKLRYYEIKDVNIILENNSKIIAQYEAEIIPYSENHSWAMTHLYYYVKIEKNNNMWKITEQTTSPITEINNNETVNIIPNESTINVKNVQDRDFTVATSMLPQAGFPTKIIIILIVITILLLLIIAIIKYKK